MINVCQKPFISEASASLIHQDGYGIDNLFSLDCKARQSGFRIERFVRPPLTLEVSFKLPLDVYYIVLGIELHENNERCKVEFTTSTKASVPVYNQKFCGSFSVNTPLTVYHNPLRVSTQVHPINLPNKVEGSQVLDKLVCQQINLQALKPINDLTTTTSIAVCLKQYTSPKALHVKCLEVWGRPSKLCTPDHLSVFEKAKETCLTSQQQCNLSSSLTLFNSGDYPHCNSLPETSVDQHKAKSDSNEQVSKIQKEETYLDQLTFELMVLPYQLPSGYYVDRLTVEKCKENDLLYGRNPCDPFTGVPYTESCQPRFCPRMKAKLDNISSQSDGASCGSSSSCGRTVGTAGQIVLHHHNLANNGIKYGQMFLEDARLFTMINCDVGRKRKWSEKMKIPENNYKKPCSGIYLGY